MLVEFISTVVGGGIIGWLASIIAKTNEQMGCLWNVLVGIIGAALGHWIAATIFHYPIFSGGFTFRKFLIDIGGAISLS